MKKVTILDIAKELDITFSTVARALNDHPAISEATKKVVKETAARLNYRRNNVASSLRSGKTNIIGVIVPEFHVTFFSSVVHGIEKVMNENGYNILLYQSNESSEHEISGIKTLLQLQVDGILVSPSSATHDYDAFKEIKNRNIPLIIFDRIMDGLEVPSVHIDDYKGGYIATEHLIQQGYKHIIHLTAVQNIKIFNERLRGYLDALKHYNVDAREELIIKGNFSIDFGKEVIKDLSQRAINYDAVFALEDYTAMGAMEELKTREIKIPEEVGVIGFSNEAFGELVSPKLSTIDQQTVKMGEEAARLFLKISKKEDDIDTVENIVLEPLLISRESSKRIG